MATVFARLGFAARPGLSAALLAGVAPWLASGCDFVTPTTHVIVGNAYDSANGCLDPQQSFDVVDGPAPGGACAVVCIVDAKTATPYVTNACPPYPALDAIEDADASDGACTAALAAWVAGNECGTSSGDASDDGGPLGEAGRDR